MLGVSRGPCSNFQVTASLRPSTWQLAQATQWFWVSGTSSLLAEKKSFWPRRNVAGIGSAASVANGAPSGVMVIPVAPLSTLNAATSSLLRS